MSPSFNGGWEVTADVDRIALIRKRVASAITTLTDKTVTVPITVTQDILSRQFVSEPLRPQTIRGTVSLVIRAIENLATANATLACVVKLCSNDGGTLKGTLYSIFGIDSEFVAVTPETRIVNAQAVTQQTVDSGDRLIVEIGCTATVPVAATATHRFGCSATSDFALTSALTTDLNPWIEFSQDLFVTDHFLSGSGISLADSRLF